MVKLRLGRSGCVAMLATPALAAVMSSVSLGNHVKFAQEAAAHQLITLSVGLTLNNLHQLEARLKAVSNPESVDYGKYLDKNEVDALFAPSADAAGAVVGWRKHINPSYISEQVKQTLTRSIVLEHGVEYISQRGPNINFATSIANANKLLNAHFAYYDVGGARKLRTRQYSVPDNVVDHIQLIHPTTYFGNIRSAMLHSPSALATVGIEISNTTSNCTSVLTPDCFRKMYGVEDYTPDTNSGSRIAFGSFLNYSARIDDLHLYQKAYGIPLANFSVELINGGLDHQDIKGKIGEANLDAQLQSAVSYPLPQLQYISGGSPPFIPNVDIPNEASNNNEPYMEFYEYLLNKTNEDLPQVISISYDDDEQTVPIHYALRVCNYIGMLGLRGISVLESSGDSGVGSACLTNDGANRTEFTPMFPSTCPYVTSVGGTQSWPREIGWFASSGGFSNYFAQPWYQSNAVGTYLDSGIDSQAKNYYEAGGYSNFSGRAFPDIAAHSARPYFSFYIANVQDLSGGTSASTPILAGIIALLNDARLRAGKPVMGFLNPFIYSLKTGGPLVDVTEGTEIGCTGRNIRSNKTIPGAGVIPYATWNCTMGWDPVTGLGTPYFKDILKLAMDIV